MQFGYVHGPLWLHSYTELKSIHLKPKPQILRTDVGTSRSNMDPPDDMMSILLYCTTYTPEAVFD